MKARPQHRVFLWLPQAQPLSSPAPSAPQTGRREIFTASASFLAAAAASNFALPLAADANQLVSSNWERVRALPTLAKPRGTVACGERPATYVRRVLTAICDVGKHPVSAG